MGTLVARRSTVLAQAHERRIRAHYTVRAGLFETSTDVDNCIARVGSQIRSLDADAQSLYVKRYGPEMFAATITKDQLEQFRIDKKFYQSWLGFKKSWDDFVDGWNDRFVSVLSADKFRDCMNFDLEQKAWRDRFTAQGIKITAPATTTPSVLPGIIPAIAPDTKGFPWGWLIAGVVLIGGALLIGQVRGVTHSVAA